MNPIVFSDLDDTLFQTARKMSEPHCDTRLASVATNGSHSYMTEAQAAQVSWLVETTRLIPVTARSTEALSRCKLPFKDYRIASNGAVVQEPDGRTDPVWDKRITQISETWWKLLSMMDDFVAARNGTQGLRHWIVEEDSRPIYFCVKSNRGEDLLDEMEDKLDFFTQGDLFKHRNGNNLAYMPHEISKRSAVEYLIDKLADVGTPVWGMGDSITDLPFMQACQMMVVPVGSQVDRKLKEGTSSHV